MSRLFKRASSQYMQGPVTSVAGVPLTLAAWLYPTDNTNQQDVLCLTSSVATGREGFFLRLDGAVAGDPVSATVSNAGVGSWSAQTSPGYQLNQWQHMAAVFWSSTERYSYLNGGSKGTDTTNHTSSGLSATTLGGSLISGAASAAFDGLCRLPAIWNAALTDSEVLMLALGAHPTMVRPDALAAYWELKDEGAGAQSFGIGGANGYTLLDKTAPSLHTSEPQIWVPGNREFGYWGAVIAAGSASPLQKRSLVTYGYTFE